MLTLSRARLRASALLLVAFIGFGAVATAAPAEAASYQSRVVSEAGKHRGKPYQYGAAGPSRFDCSGFTQYVFSRLGKKLPHNSAEQYKRVHHIAKSRLATGDLVFVKNSSGRIYHVGIYAGGGKWWHSPKSGDVVKLAPIFSNNYVVGRI